VKRTQCALPNCEIIWQSNRRTMKRVRQRSSAMPVHGHFPRSGNRPGVYAGFSAD
jgi:hypothetical protein